MFSGNISASADVYVKRFAVEKRNSVFFTPTDKTSGLLVATMRHVFPMLRGCAPGPDRLAMDVEKPTWGKRNKRPNKLRRIIRKFTPAERGNAAGGQFFDGGDVDRIDEEARMRNTISTEGRSQRYDMDQLKSIKPHRGFDSRGEFSRYLSYLAAAYPVIAEKAELPGPFASY